MNVAYLPGNNSSGRLFNNNRTVSQRATTNWIGREAGDRSTCARGRAFGPLRQVAFSVVLRLEGDDNELATLVCVGWKWRLKGRTVEKGIMEMERNDWSGRCRVGFGADER